MLKRFLFLVLLASSTVLPSQAQPEYRLPSAAAIDSLHRQLWQSAPGTDERLRLLLRLSEVLVDRKEQFETTEDSLAFYSQQALALAQQRHDAVGSIRALQVAGRLRREDNPATAQARLLESIHRSKRLGNKQLEALGWVHMANTYVSTAETVPLILSYFQHAIELYRQLGDKLQEAQVLRYIATENIIQGQHQQALQHLAQAADLYQAAHYHNLRYLYADLLYAYKKLGNYREALRYGLESIENARTTQDTLYLGATYGKIASVYLELEQPPEGLRYFRKAYHSFRQEHLRYEALTAMGHIASMLIQQKRPKEALASLLKAIQEASYKVTPGSNPQITYYLANCYQANGQMKQAERYYLMALGALEQHSDAQKLYVYADLGEFYLATKKYEKARFYTAKSLTLASRVGARPRIIQAHLTLFKIDSAQARYLDAIAHFQKYKLLNDTLFSTSKSKQIAALQIQYDTKKKEQNIALLTKQSQVQQASLRQRELQRNATLGGAVLLTLLLGLSYNRARLKKRSAHLLEVKQLEINQKNQVLEQVLGEKDGLLAEKESLLVEKEGLIVEKEGLLVEKEWMLKEIHHRVKNNLQIVSELLDSQLDRLREPQLLAIVRESQNRVQAMALVHQKLYQAQNLARVDMQEYIREIVEHLLTSFHCEQTVQEHLDIAPIELDVALATPLGLIINEAVTNSLKYAFPDSRPGTISISLAQLPNQRYRLTLADDGVGFPAGFDFAASRSMGLTLITGLSEQLEADLTFSQNPGVSICLEFEGARKAVPTEMPAR